MFSAGPQFSEHQDLSSSYEHNLNFQNFSDALQLTFSGDTNFDPGHQDCHDPLSLDQYEYKKELYLNFNTADALNLNYPDHVQLQDNQYSQLPNDPFYAPEPAPQYTQELPSISSLKEVKHQVKLEPRDSAPLWNSSAIFLPEQDSVNINCYSTTSTTDPARSISTPLSIDTQFPDIYDYCHAPAPPPQYCQDSPVSPASLQQHNLFDSADPGLTTTGEAALLQQEASKKLSKWKEKVTKSTDVCVVCGDKSSGWHYNVLACEGCKGFFRRSIARSLQYTCKFSNSCEIDMYMRKRCQACRLRKCYARGMKSECVEPPHVVAEKAEKKRRMEEDAEAASLAKKSRLNLPPLDIRPLNTSELDLVTYLVQAQADLEHPSVEILDQIDSLVAATEEAEESSLVRVTQTTLETVKLIIGLTKRLPGFQTLCQADQLAVLKSSSSECMMIRTARRYDSSTGHIVFSNNDTFDNSAFDRIGLRNDELYQFCRKVAKLNMDDAEFSLLTAITVFSDREGVTETEKVEQIQMEYVKTLRTYINYNRPDPSVHLGSLLQLLAELRSVAAANTAHCLYLYKMRPHLLHPLIKELWDIPS